jgi:autotransporter translocation and assembly factor TamB
MEIPNYCLSEEIYPFEPGDPLDFDDEFFDQPVEGEINIPSNSISFWKQFLDNGSDLEAEGMLSFNSQITGSAGHPVFDGQVILIDGDFSGVAIDSVRVDIRYIHEESDIHFDGIINSLGTRIADMEAVLPLHVDLRAFTIEFPQNHDEVYVSFNSEDFDLAILSEFLDRDMMRDFRGRLTGNIELSGPIASLEPRGSFQLRDGNLRVLPMGITLGDIQSDLNINPERVELQSFSMSSGPGRFSANGFVELNEFEPGNVDFRIDATQFRAANTSDMNAILDLNSRLRGSFTSPELTGSLRFRSGFINLQNFGEQAIEDVQLEDDPDPVEIAFYDSMLVEMNVIFDRQFFIRNRQYLDMEIELAGEIDLVKSAGSDLEMFGSMEGVRGYARPMGRNFELEEAIVSFFGPIGNPELNVRTRYRPPQSDEEITIWYIIEGTVEDPEFRFESEPFLELQDIISYTLFGRPFYALESWQQAVSGGGSGASAADVALDLLLDRFETLAAQQLGIDVVQIDTDRTGSTNSTTIKTGWYLSDRIFFAVLNEISGTSPKTLFMLEYLIRRNLELIVTQGDDSREGVDLRWRYDY